MMKVAYFGCDFLFSCFELFVENGYDIVCIYTVEHSVHTEQIVSYAQKNQIAIFFNKPMIRDMDNLICAGVELFFAAEFPWKIPIPKQLKFAINFHPTLLPEGRGCTPVPSLILERHDCAGITFHKMTDKFDEGDILLQKKIDIQENETFDTLSAKIYIEAAILLDELLSDINGFYEDSVAQKGGTYWPKITHRDQSVVWSLSTSRVLKKIQSFGSLGVYAEINQELFLILAAEGVLYQHTFSPGTVIYSDKIKLAVATEDGLIVILTNCLISLDGLNCPIST